MWEVAQHDPLRYNELKAFDVNNYYIYIESLEAAQAKKKKKKR